VELERITYATQYGNCLATQPDWIEDLLVEDRLEEVVLVFGLEWRLACGLEFVAS
jgi:hypothetical protein